VWFASESGALLAVDARADELRALWRLPRLPSGVLGIARRPGHCHFLVQPEWNVERWSLELPSYTLRARTEVLPGPEGTITIPAVSSDGLVACADFHGLAARAAGGAVTQSLRLFRSSDDQRVLGVGPVLAIWPPFAGPGHVASLCPSRDGVRVAVVEAGSLSPVAQVDLPGARLAAVRFSGESAAICDDAGRVVVVDLDRGRVTAEIRR